jgi:hypothetical protein
LRNSTTRAASSRRVLGSRRRARARAKSAHHRSAARNIAR